MVAELNDRMQLLSNRICEFDEVNFRLYPVVYKLILCNQTDQNQLKRLVHQINILRLYELLYYPFYLHKLLTIL